MPGCSKVLVLIVVSWGLWGWSREISADQSPAAAPATLALVDLAAPESEARFKPTSPQVTIRRVEHGVVMEVAEGGDGYPGALVAPAAAEAWDLSRYGHVVARVTNRGTAATTVALRVDNRNNGSDCNTESVFLKPGQTGTVKVIFGYSFGFKPGFKLDPKRVTSMILFVHKAKAPQFIGVELIEAAGAAGESPPVRPESVRSRPPGGVVFGSGVAFEPNTQLECHDGATAAIADGALRLSFAARKGGQWVLIKPAIGRWDWTRGNELRFACRNSGSMEIAAGIRLLSDKGEHPLVRQDKPLAPGERREFIVSFVPPIPWKGIPDSGDRTSWDGQPGTGTKFGSDAVKGIRIGAGDGPAAMLDIDSITLGVATATTPEWLGKRPPAEGEWQQTLADEFVGTTLDEQYWSCYGENFYDTKSHYSKANAIVGDGVLRMRYEKKRGLHNDSAESVLALTKPKTGESDYATGYLTSYGRWVQRYGYFEARMRLPDAPGLWPAFWLMPDRGAATGPQWVRADTGNGGMEFDIMEPLTRWGPYRFNVAFHWDGYQKGHKQTGSEQIYFKPDSEGFVTVGLLWLPGSAKVFVNGTIAAEWQAERISIVPSNLLFTHVAGGWDNNGLDDSTLPADFVIDYVRVWQRKDLASGEDGGTIQAIGR